MKENIKVACAKSVLETVTTASAKLRNAIDEAKTPEEIIGLTSAVCDLVRVLFMQGAVMPVLTDIVPAPCEDGSEDGNI